MMKNTSDIPQIKTFLRRRQEFSSFGNAVLNRANDICETLRAAKVCFCVINYCRMNLFKGFFSPIQAVIFIFATRSLKQL